VLVELLTNLHPLDARSLVDDHTERKDRVAVIQAQAREQGWTDTNGARTILAEVAGYCTDGSASRATLTQVVGRLEGALGTSRRISLFGMPNII
jgi:hypothetical protein